MKVYLGIQYGVNSRSIPCPVLGITDLLCYEDDRDFPNGKTMEQFTDYLLAELRSKQCT